MPGRVLTRPSPLPSDGATAGAGLTDRGLRALRDLERRLTPEQLGALYRAIDDLRAYLGLLRMAAAGNRGAIATLKQRILAMPLEHRRLLAPSANPPSPPSAPDPPGQPSDGPCNLVGPPPINVVNAGLNLSGFLDTGTMPDPGSVIDTVLPWIDNAVAVWMIYATGVNAMLNGDAPGTFVPRLLVRSCLSDYQVCVGNFVFTALPILTQFLSAAAPPVGMVTPSDQCLAGAGPIYLFPIAGGSFPQQSKTSGLHPTIDGSPATVLSWTPSDIQLALPPGITTGCHTIGWTQLLSSGAVNQLQNAAQQCGIAAGGGALAGAPYALSLNVGDFSLIDAPVIDTFCGPGGYTTLDIEACRPVTLTWATSLEACPSSKARIVVDILSDGKAFRANLPPNGQISVYDDTTHTYTLEAKALYGTSVCGTATSSVTVTRHKDLTVQPPHPSRCNPQGVAITVDVTISCPAPPGGLTVTATSADPSIIGGAVGTIPEGNQTTTLDLLAGNACGVGWVTFTVPGYSDAHAGFTIVAPPVIGSTTPTTFQECAPVTVSITGGCLGEFAGEVSAWVTVHGQKINGTVTMPTIETAIDVAFPSLPAGSYPIAIQRCSLTSFTAPITVTARNPTIDSFSSPSTDVELCAMPTIPLSWSVRDAVSVTITRDTKMIAQRTYTPSCTGSSMDSLTDTLPVVTAGVTYTLTAFNVDGVTTTKSLSLPLTSTASPASAFIAQNGSGATHNLFFIAPTGGAFMGQILSGQTASLAVPPCALVSLVSIDPAAVATHNAETGDNLDPTSVTAAVTTGAWTVTTTSPVIGSSTASPIMVGV